MSFTMCEHLNSLQDRYGFYILYTWMNFSQRTCEAKTYLNNAPTSTTQNFGQYVI